MPGMAAPARRSVKGGHGPPTLMSAITPSATAMTTSSAQPSGSRAVVKWKWRMGQGPVSWGSMPQLWTNLHAATMTPGGEPYGAVMDAAILVDGERIAWVGSRADAPAVDHTQDAGGAWVTPGLVDCHTHLVYGGNRAREFEQRLQGATYEDLARAGGGILSTVAATRALSEAELVEATLPRLDALLAEGVTTVEIKSGYGLDGDTELRMLRAARALMQHRAVSVVTSFLGAHAIPSGKTADSYMDEVIAMLPAVAPFADAVDGFCDDIGFTREQTSRLFDAARAHGLRVKLPRRAAQQPGWRPRCWRNAAGCRRTTLNTWTRPGSMPWQPPAPSPSCCLARSISCAKPRPRPSPPCAPPGCR